MRRVRVVLVAALLASAPACAITDRPEGIVERWLLALNQGAAGRPGEYAADHISDRLLPHRDEREPGQLDVIEVGRGAPNGAVYLVPFRIVRTDGTTFRGTATVARGRVLDVGRQPAVPPFPSEGGPGIGSAGPVAWAAAGAIAVLLIAATAALMRLTPAEPARR